MMSNRTKIIIAITATILVLAIGVAVGELYNDNSSVPKPFAFNLSTKQNNGTVMQAQNLTITIDAAYIEGQPEPITLSANGGPNGTLYQFSNQTGTLTKTQPFTCNLTIFVPPSANSGSYLIDVTSNASTPTSHALFNLTVLNAQIQVYGNVTIASKVTISGVTIDVIPTDILFTSNTTGETYQAKVHRFTDTPLAPGRTGNYSILLPNQQSYHVEFYCFSYPHYVPVLRTPISAGENGHFTVSSGAGLNSTVANFTG